MNIYFEYSIEKSLKFFFKKKNQKIIFIRKILGFKIIALFFSYNRNHLKWIQKFPNCLYADKVDILKEYIINYNIKGLKNIKTKVEKMYNISLKEFTDYFIFHNNEEEENNSSIISNNITEYNKYIRHVHIYCKNQNLYLESKQQ